MQGVCRWLQEHCYAVAKGHRVFLSCHYVVTRVFRVVARL